MDADLCVFAPGRRVGIWNLNLELFKSTNVFCAQDTTNGTPFRSRPLWRVHVNKRPFLSEFCLTPKAVWQGSKWNKRCMLKKVHFKFKKDLSF